MVLGLRLRLTATAEGGRQSPLRGVGPATEGYPYRPNWGLPGMGALEQTGAPVLGFSDDEVTPGQETHAVIRVLVPSMLPEWERATVGTELPMYEGPRVCGRGTVLWRELATLPLAEDAEDRYRAWLRAPQDGPPDGG